MRAPWLWSAVAASACASPPANPIGGVALLDVDVTTGRVSTTSSAPLQFSVEMADHGVRMPQSIFIDGIDRVGTDTCPTESGIGISVFPAIVAVSPGRGGVDATGSLMVDLAGPVIARLAVAWTAPYTCSGAQQANGTSTLTIFPNGRIVRYDVATPSTTTLVQDGGACGCSSQSTFSFESFWSFTATQVVNPDGTPWSTGSPTGCAVYSNHTIGVAWPDGSTHERQTATISSFVHDWAADAATLPPTQQQVTSAIILSEQSSAASCGDVLADLDDFPITIGGQMIVTDTSGIYDDQRTHTDPVEIAAPRAIPKGFAIALDVGDFASVTRSPAADGAWYGVQSDGTRSIFWFRDGLAVGETITIEPR